MQRGQTQVGNIAHKAVEHKAVKHQIKHRVSGIAVVGHQIPTRQHALLLVQAASSDSPGGGSGLC